jgi:hypothetical protein
MKQQQGGGSDFRAVAAGLLSWVVPGGGHFFLGERWRGTIFLVVITITFWTGVAIGGVKSTVDPVGHRAWFLAEMMSGSNVLAALALSSTIPAPRPGVPSRYLAAWPADDIGIVYCGVAGLLNLLVLIDAIGRGAQPVAKRRTPRSPPTRSRT